MNSKENKDKEILKDVLIGRKNSIDNALSFSRIALQYINKILTGDNNKGWSRDSDPDNINLKNIQEKIALEIKALAQLRKEIQNDFDSIKDI